MIFTTHDMSDIEKTCDHLIIIDQGKKIYDGTVNKMLKIYGKQRKLVIELDDSTSKDLQLDDKIMENVTIHNDGKDLCKWTIEFDGERIKIDYIIKAILDKYTVNDIDIRDMDIENIVRDIYDGRIEIK